MHSIAFEIGGVAIHWYGVLVAFGFLAGLWTAGRRGLRVGVTPELIWDLGTWVVVGSLVGARAWYVVEYWQTDFAGRPWLDVLKIRQGGLVYYGGLVGAIVAMSWVARVRSIRIWLVADVMAPSIALGHVFGRMGCLMTGCCYGRPTSVAWAIRFPADHWTHGVAVHPTQVYESLSNLVLCLFLAWWFRTRRRWDGQVFALYLAGYAVLRAGVETFRGDYVDHGGRGMLTPGQLTGLGVLGFAIWLWVWRGGRVEKTVSGGADGV